MTKTDHPLILTYFLFSFFGFFYHHSQWRRMALFFRAILSFRFSAPQFSSRIACSERRLPYDSVSFFLILFFR